MPFPSLSLVSLTAATIAQVIALAVLVAITLVAITCLPPSLPLPSFASLLKPPPSTSNTIFFGWLLCFYHDWQPPKACALPIYLFLDESSFGAPSKGTSLGNHKTATKHL
jgi:hypothetical protein